MIIRLRSAFCSILAVVAIVAAVLSQAAPAMAQTVSRTDAGNNNYGHMFDVTSTIDLTVTEIVSDVDTPGSFELYGRSGTFVGHESSSAGWTLLDTSSAAAGSGQLVFNLAKGVPAGQAAGFYIVSTGTGVITYTTSTGGIGATWASDANLTIREGAGLLGSSGTVKFAGVTNFPRALSGSVTYAPGLPPATVPTMTEWALLLFGLLLAGGAAVIIQRRPMIG